MCEVHAHFVRHLRISGHCRGICSASSAFLYSCDELRIVTPCLLFASSRALYLTYTYYEGIECARIA